MRCYFEFSIPLGDYDNSKDFLHVGERQHAHINVKKAHIPFSGAQPFCEHVGHTCRFAISNLPKPTIIIDY